MSRERRLALVAALAAIVFAAGCVSSGKVWRGEAPITDVPLYATYGNRMEDGQVPYRDFRFEYPPGALPALVLPALATGDDLGYARWFGGLMAAFGVVAIALTALTLALLGAGPGRAALALTPLAVSPIVLGSLLLTRFDLLPAALTAGVLAAAVAGRPRLAGAVLGVAVGVKLYPAVLLPVLGAWAWRRFGRRESLTVLGLGAVVPALAYLPFFLLSPDGVVSSIGRQLSRPLQIESLGSGVLLVAHNELGTGLAWTSTHGSQNLTGVAAGATAVALTAVQLCALAWIWVRFARGVPSTARLVRYAAAAAVAFVALGKVLSPQFLIWLLPLVPLVGGARGKVAALLLLTACVLTRAWFPGDYWDLVREFDRSASWLVLLRGLTLVALLVTLAWPTATARARAPARSPSPARSSGRT